MKPVSSAVPLKIATVAALVGLAVVASYSAYWAYRIATLAVIPNFLHDWEQGRVRVDLMGHVFLIAAVLAFAICCRLAWLLFKFARNCGTTATKDKHSQTPV